MWSCLCLGVNTLSIHYYFYDDLCVHPDIACRVGQSKTNKRSMDPQRRLIPDCYEVMIAMSWLILEWFEKIERCIMRGISMYNRRMLYWAWYTKSMLNIKCLFVHRNQSASLFVPQIHKWKLIDCSRQEEMLLSAHFLCISPVSRTRIV